MERKEMGMLRWWWENLGSVFEREEGIIKEKQQNFKGVCSLKLQGNLQKSLTNVPAPVTHTQAELCRAAHTRDSITHRKLTGLSGVEQKVCVQAHMTCAHTCVWPQSWLVLHYSQTNKKLKICLKNSAKAGSPFPVQKTLCQDSSWIIFWSLKISSEGC